MSCVFTCDACKQTVVAEYRHGRWQHPDGWWTRAAQGADAGYTACCEACMRKVDTHERASRPNVKRPVKAAA
ncbi:MAG: hypothetical protein R3B57_05150 [Phycisphaerales bacterium]